MDILFKDEIKRAPDPNKRREELLKAYREEFASPYQAASRGYVDEVIVASQTRQKVIRALRFLKNKKVEGVKKKHGNMPL